MEVIAAAKSATVILKNRKTIGKAVVIGILAVAMPFLAISVSILELVSAFTPDGAVPSTSTMDITNTAIYTAVKEATQPYYDDLWENMGIKRREIMAEHTEMVTLLDENGNEYQTEKCDVIVSRHMNYLGDAYLISYLVCVKGIDVDTAAINKNVAYDFLDSISEMIVIEGSYEYEITNQFLSLEEITTMYFPDISDANKFIASCEAYGQFMELSADLLDIEAGNWTNISFSSTKLMEVPLYLQYKGNWSKVSYGNGSIKNNGCAPTCLAMVLSYMRQEEILPSDVVSWCGNRYYVNGTGTSWEIFDAVESSWGIKCTSIGKNQTVLIQALREGKPVIASMGPGTFTKGGHFIVLSGITMDGKITVKDPNDNAFKNHVGKEFDMNLILRECKNLWVCS